MCNLKIVSVTSDTTAKPCEWVQANATSGAIDVTPPSSPREGSEFAVTKTDASANAVTVLLAGDDQELPSQGDSVVYRYDGDEWIVVALELGRTTAALQPLPASTVAAWALNTDQSSRNISGHDRANINQDHALGLVNAFNAPDIIPGERAFQTWFQESPSGVAPQGMQQSSADPGLQLRGEMTLMGRACKATYAPGASASFFEYLAVCGLYGPSDGSGNVCYSLVLNRPTQSLLYYAQRTSAGTGIQFDSGLVFSDGLWHFISLRRTAAGVVTLGVDDTFVTSGALALPDLGSEGRMFIGRPAWPGAPPSPDTGFLGFEKDWLLASERLSDAEVIANGKIACGPYWQGA